MLPVISKILERLMNSQIMQFLKHFLSPLLRAFKPGYSNQHALLRFVEKFKESLDKKGLAGAVSIDLQKRSIV